jgi:glycosyltransferase involved in cell wall biosynthesis
VLADDIGNMNIIQLTPGAAGMYCGGCIRDNALVGALRRQGHDALMVPLYTPIKTDEPSNSYDRIFFGGLNVYLQQKSAIFRKMPGWMDRPLDNPSLLQFVAGFGVKTRAEDVGELMISMLKGEDGYQAKELEKLIDFLSHNLKPHVICLSNILLAGMARSLRQRLNVPVVCTLAGEDSFIDSLPTVQREGSWNLLRQRAADIDAFIPVSHYYGGVMSKRLDLPQNKIFVIHNGIDISGYGPASAPPKIPTIGYLARVGPEKGLRTLVEAFKILRRNNKVPNARLRVAGGVSPNDEKFVEELRVGFAKEGLARDVDFLPNISRDEKIRFLQSLSVFSVPATYGEAFGLYLIEAMACGVPAVQPDHAAFPELIAATKAGVLCKPDDAQDLAHKLEALLLDEPRRAALGAAGRKKVVEHYHTDRLAKDVVKIFETAIAKRG